MQFYKWTWKLPTFMEELYMKIELRMFLRLRKFLYCLKQISRFWDAKFSTALLNLCFGNLEFDSCLRICKSEKKVVNHIYWWQLLERIEMILITSKAKLSTMLEMSDYGRLKYYFGMKITYKSENGTLWLSQDGQCAAWYSVFCRIYG